MTTLIELIENTLDIPHLEAGSAVMDGSFFITPFQTMSLRGNGGVQRVDTYLAIDMFYKSNDDIVTNTNVLFGVLGNDSRYVVQDPDYVYDRDADYWQSTMIITIIGGI